MKRMIVFGVAAAVGAAQVSAGPVQRAAVPEAPIASSVSVSAPARIVYVSGTVPDPVAPAATGAARFGDTEAQTRSILSKIVAELKRQGLGMGDVVMMRVFLVAPAGQQQMDFQGMMRGYRAFFGTAAQPNKPARSTMEVAGLVDPDWLVEIEVTAAR